jgi:hypothetical protein
VDGLIALLRGLGERPDVACRGEARACFGSLHTSLDRVLEEAGELSGRAGMRPHAELLAHEGALVERFRQRAAIFLSPAEVVASRTVLGTLQLMRHYGAPTRLLDWSMSPWVSCYFACEDAVGEDGVIWAMGLDDLLARTAGRRERDRALAECERVEEWVALLATPAREPALVEPDRANTRMLAQQGLFTMAEGFGVPHDGLLEAAMPGARLERVVVPSGLKRPMMALLSTMNIGAMSLFPGPDGLGRELHENTKWGLRLSPLTPRAG